MTEAGASDAPAALHLRHLRRRVREEAEAAASAVGLDSTLVHLALAIAYARRLRDGKRAA